MCICLTALSLIHGHAISMKATVVSVLFTNNGLKGITIWQVVGTPQEVPGWRWWQRTRLSMQEM